MDDIEQTHRWYLVRTRASDEPVAFHNLVDQGFESYFPRLVRRIRLRGRRVRKVCPLFPRYLFLQVAIGIQNFATARSTRGVAAIVRFGENYATVPDEVIACLKGYADPHTGLHRLEERRLWPHSPIRILGGTFEGLEGIFLRDCGEDRVLVLLSVLGQNAPVELPEALVGPIARQRPLPATGTG